MEISDLGLPNNTVKSPIYKDKKSTYYFHIQGQSYTEKQSLLLHMVLQNLAV